MYQRSADMGLGVPFNIASYALLTCMIAHVCGMLFFKNVSFGFRHGFTGFILSLLSATVFAFWSYFLGFSFTRSFLIGILDLIFYASLEVIYISFLSCTGLVPGDFIHVLGDTHVYRNHVRPLQEQLQKQPKPFPVRTIMLNKNFIDS